MQISSSVCTKNPLIDNIWNNKSRCDNFSTLCKNKGIEIIGYLKGKSSLIIINSIWKESMNTNILKIILKSIGITILVVVASYLLIGKMLVFAFNYSTVESSYQLPTHALLIGLIFVFIFCTILILDKIEHFTKEHQ